MSFFVTVLGSSSATPTDHRNPSSQCVHYENKLFLVDCGEGTQMQMRRYSIKATRINHIFISHLHGDHYLGLMGLLSTYHLNGRTSDLYVFSPPGLEDIIELQKKVAATNFTYKVHFHVLTQKHKHLIVETDKLNIYALPLEHRIPTYGFIFEEKPGLPRIRKEAIESYNLSFDAIAAIKRGEPVHDADGHVIPNHLLTLPQLPPRSFAYISDTAATDSIADAIKGISLLYHEATFCEDMKKVAAEKFHSTAIQAAETALRASAKRLLIGHFSARYPDASLLLAEAGSVFPDSYAVEEGKQYPVP